MNIFAQILETFLDEGFSVSLFKLVVQADEQFDTLLLKATNTTPFSTAIAKIADGKSEDTLEATVLEYSFICGQHSAFKMFKPCVVYLSEQYTVKKVLIPMNTPEFLLEALRTLLRNSTLFNSPYLMEDDLKNITVHKSFLMIKDLDMQIHFYVDNCDSYDNRSK